MNVNVWNIKDMFSTSAATGPNKSSSWTSAPSDYNSMSDSQFLFGSQFCPENSQSASTPVEFSIQQRPGKTSQQNSQDSEPSIFAKYQSKPQLFSGDGKERSSINFPAGRFKSALEQFEENKKKIKEKHDSEVLNSFIGNTKESLQKLQSSLDKSEETLTSMLNGLDNLAKTMQETSQSHYGLILNALKDRSEMEQTLLGIKKTLEDKDVASSDLKSSLQLLNDSLEQLKTQQTEWHLKLSEQLGHLQLPTLLAELQAFTSALKTPRSINDNASQTSPDTLSANQPPNSQPPGNKFFSIVGTSQGKENVNKEQKGYSLTTSQDDNNAFFTCCPDMAALAGISEECRLLTQEPYEATPVRKVIKRKNLAKGLGAMQHSPVNCSHGGNVAMQTHAQRLQKPITAPKMQSRSSGSRIRKGRSQKCSQRKREYPSRKGQHPKPLNTNLRGKETRKECVESERLQDDSVNPAHSSTVSQQKTHRAQNGKAEKSKFLLQSHENMQHGPNQQEMLGVQKNVDMSNTKNNSFWACSSPESSLSQNQWRWFSLSENLSPTCSISAPQKMMTRCPLFFDSDYSD